MLIIFFSATGCRRSQNKFIFFTHFEKSLLVLHFLINFKRYYSKKILNSSATSLLLPVELLFLERWVVLCHVFFMKMMSLIPCQILIKLFFFLEKFFVIVFFTFLSNLKQNFYKSSIVGVLTLFVPGLLI